MQQIFWWALDYWYAGYRQIRGRYRRPDPGRFRSGYLVPIVIIPGVFENWHFMLPLIRELHQAGHPVHVVATLHNNRAPVPAGASIVADYLREYDLHGVIIVAHSKGGLIGKYLMSFDESSDRVRQMIAIATPFSGSRYAEHLPGRELREFSPLDATVKLLSESILANQRIVSIFARFDPHIPAGSWLSGARNMQIDTGGHFLILQHPEARAAVIGITSELAPSE